MKYEIAVKVDTNDADYVTRISYVSESVLERLRVLFKVIDERTKEAKEAKRYNFYNFPHSEYRDETPEEIYPEFTVPMEPLEGWSEGCTLLDLFYETCCPYSRDGFHTIESIHVYPVSIKEQLV